VLLVLVILSEIGTAVYALISRADFQDAMTKQMEDSFSKYNKDTDITKEWKSLQTKVIIVHFLL
jgi:hypothetical protein